MKLLEIRLYKLKVIKDNEVIFEGMAEDMPENIKGEEAKNIELVNGEAIVNI